MSVTVDTVNMIVTDAEGRHQNGVPPLGSNRPDFVTITPTFISWGPTPIDPPGRHWLQDAGSSINRLTAEYHSTSWNSDNIDKVLYDWHGTCQEDTRKKRF
jgi:hypothetical protein